MSDEVVKEPLKVTVGFERKVQVRQFETAVASIHVQADVPLDADATALEAAIRDAFFQAKASVFEQLGIAFEVTENGAVMELIEKILGPVEVVSTAPAAATKSADAPRSCPDCNGSMFDNRPDKASGKSKPTYPDFKCKDKACGKAVWIDKRK